VGVGREVQRASRSSNQSVFIVTGSSQASRRVMASSDWSIIGRCFSASMPIM
jgi:hypothetical protein